MAASPMEFVASGRMDLDGTHGARIETHYPLAREAFPQGSVEGSVAFARIRSAAGRECGCIVEEVSFSANRHRVELDRWKMSHLGIRDGDVVHIEPLVPVEAARARLEGPDDLSDVELESLHRRPLVPGETTALFTVSGAARPVTLATSEPEGIVLLGPGTAIERAAGEAAEAPLSYRDIGGLQREIRQIREVVEYPLRHPHLFERLGIAQPKGLILHGPSGTGKTLIVRTVAARCGAKIFSLSGAEVYSKYYGESEKKLREVFEEAREAAPSLIVIDELDALFPQRDSVRGELENRVVSSFLSLMDGIQSLRGVVVIGTTNRLDAIDPALRREGRFGVEIHIGVPDMKARREILDILVRRMPLSDDVDLDMLAEKAVGFAGADLALLCREAAYCSLRERCPLDEAGALSNQELADLSVGSSHFRAALAQVRPSAMREFLVEVPDVSFEDIGGLDEVKRLLVENVEYPLTRRDVFLEAGVRPARGLLLYGPPGTGKTLLAKATARQTGANFISIKGPEVRSKWYGESEQRIRHIFQKARESTPCVIFFDELDALAPSRGGQSETSDALVNQLLSEMDGVESADGVFVLAATNRPELLDPALLRPGRFDFQVEVPLPDEAARRSILDVHLARKPLAADVDVEELVRATDGFSGAEIAEVCRQGALSALREAGFRSGGLEVTAAWLGRAVEDVGRTRDQLTPERIGFQTLSTTGP